MPSANADWAPAHALSPLPHHPVKARAEEEAAEAAAPEVVSTGNALVDALLVRSADNKALNDKKRLATSYANLARSRTVTDGTCAFPDNLIGCENKVRRTPYTATQSKWTRNDCGVCSRPLVARRVARECAARPSLFIHHALLC